MADTEHAEQPGQLSVVSTASEGVRVVTLAGEIDHHTGEAMRQALDVTGTAGPCVVVDMRGVSFMDSTGINILIAAHRNLTEAGGWLRLAAVTEAVLRTIQIVGVDSVIDCHDTLRQALDA
ncbi:MULTISPECIES: STAS domain-containing protein [unclassified Streptomyces]|uniref:STAS domain-containing protein n=1 Tax=unclassified Streptomyces TaxID=2593676 RepID=UPI002E784386|nr:MULTISPECIES: STAS domain-containing protein [unclassified Streptomyces]MEE1758808.1 STAS domain-containing protein [Streptomyces sp. SP18BB07]MEE1829832.1 STAS domain-containing protein [Streptomyces sp. SP17KL33]